MEYSRTDRVGETIKKEISNLLQREIKDPRIGFVSLTRVKVSKDLRYATVHVSIMGDEEAKRVSMEGLTSATGFIRRELWKRLRMRRVPELDFKMDDSIEYGVHISKLLRDLER